MIGTDRTQYIKSEKFKGIVVTHRDYDQLREANPDSSLIAEEATRITMANPELKTLDAECAVIVYKKMKHLDSIRTHISNIGLLTSFDVKNNILPQIVLRICNSMQHHNDDISFYVMKVYGPNYTITTTAPEERTLATCGEHNLNIKSIMQEMEFSEELSKGADKIYRDGAGFSNIFAFAVQAYKQYTSSTKMGNIQGSFDSI